MLRASALVYSLVMALIIAILSSSILLYSYFSTASIRQYEKKERLLENVNSGINLLLSDQALVGLDENKTIDLFGEGRDPVTLQRKAWGAFEIIHCSASWKGTRVSKTAMVGRTIGLDSDLCFYLAEHDAPLSVCGKTKLKGTCYLPKEGTKSAYIEGENFIGDKPVDGLIRNSDKRLPEINKEMFEALDDLMSDKTSMSDSIIDVSSLPDSLSNDFLSKTILISSGGPLLVQGKFLSGNILIRSNTSITIGGNTILSNVIVTAPKIKIEKNFSGSVQLFANDSIIIKEHCHFGYPSVLGLLRTERSANSISICIGEECSIYGDVFAYQGKYDPRKQSLVLFQKTDTVKGIVFTDDALSLQGTVYGAVVVNKILLKTTTAIYEGHLLDVVVDRKRLSTYYLGTDLWKETGTKRVAAWLE